MKLNNIWVVHDPTPDSELIDILYEAKGPNELASLIIGTGLSQWKHENTTLYTEEGEAKKDAEARMKKQKKQGLDLLRQAWPTTTNERYAVSSDEACGDQEARRGRVDQVRHGHGREADVQRPNALQRSAGGQTGDPE